MCSANMADKVTSFIVNSDWDMTSDHFPISITLSAELKPMKLSNWITRELIGLSFEIFLRILPYLIIQ
jgi:hypothetical protein